MPAPHVLDERGVLVELFARRGDGLAQPAQKRDPPATGSPHAVQSVTAPA